MKSLNGKELSEYIKDRQAMAVRSLSQGYGINPKLAIIKVKDDPVINTYVRLKHRYGNDIGAEVESFDIDQTEVPELVKKLNKDKSIHGIIIQLPLQNIDETDELVNLIKPEKDVDALASKSSFEPATPIAILWLLAGYNVDLKNKSVVIVGKGKLVGSPLEKMLLQSGVNVVSADKFTENLSELTLSADVIITATGKPSVITPDMVKQGAVVVDAGVATESGKTVGDLNSKVYDREDLTLTPVKGGVGPLTVCALFENVIKAAQMTIPKE